MLLELRPHQCSIKRPKQHVSIANTKHISRPEYQHRTLDNVLQKLELCPTKAASQRTQLSGVKLKIFFLSYRPLKTNKHLVSIGLSRGLFFLMNILIDNLLMQLLYIQIHKMYFNEKILYQYFFFSFPSESILSLHITKNLKKV